MKHSHLRRRFSFAPLAFVFLAFTLAEMVEVRAVTALLSPSLANEQLVRDEPSPRMGNAFDVKRCKSVRKGVGEA